MKFLELVHANAILPELQATDRNAVIREMVQAIVATGGLPEDQAEGVIKSIIARERTRGTTGFGKGVAAPHAKVEGLAKVVASVGRSTPGIDFSSLDGGLVHGVFLILSPTSAPEEHLRAMDLIFRHLQQERFRKFLRQATDADAILDLLREADEKTMVS